MTAPHQTIMSPGNPKGSSTPQQQQHQYLQSGAGNLNGVSADGIARRHGSSAFTRVHSNPRNVQLQRKQNKTHRRPRLEEEDEPLEEHPSIRTLNSRRGQTNITHLMSFALPPRPSEALLQFGRGSRGGTAWRVGYGHQTLNKSKYIHANYRFVVDPRGDYKQQLLDSDIHLDWDLVLQILAVATEDTSCPICLSTPVAPRMAKCGHIFCLPCIIRYVHAADDTNSTEVKRRRWKSCPICFDSIFMHEMKPVRWIFNNPLEEPREGRDVVLRLLLRQSNSTIALPRDSAQSSITFNSVPWHFEPDAIEYAHFMKGTETYMGDQYENETKALQAQEKEDELMFGEETTWSQKAINTIKELQERIRGLEHPLHDTSSETSSKLTSSGSNDSVCFYFYNAPLHSYLSPLDIKILKAAFGEFSLFPSTLLPRVDHVSTGHVVDEDIRRRAKYLHHLPLGYEINFLECDWTDIVPQNILDMFSYDLQRRRRRNQEKALREEKARLRAEQSEDKKLYGNRHEVDGTVVLESTSNTFCHDYSNLSSSADLTASSTSPSWATSTDRQAASFAPLASPSTSPSGPRTVWGTPIVVSTSPKSSTQQSSLNMTTENDGWLQDWEKDLLDEKDLIETTQSASLSGNFGETSRDLPEISRKRKKKTKITLMSTNGRRAA